jgi:hypothetical protein
LKYRGEPFAEVWFKPDGEPFTLTFRIPQTRFQSADMLQQLTAANLLKAVGIVTTEVESWRHEGAAISSTNASLAELSQCLPQPVSGVPHLHLFVRLTPPAEAVACNESGAPKVSEARWQELETRWNTILGFEANVETIRIAMESLRAEMEASVGKRLTGNDKIYAPNADVAQWTKAKSRVLFALPKLREFIHRATWAMATPERKKLGLLFKDYVQQRIPFPQLDGIAEQMESVLKNRQVLAMQGASLHQECKTIAAEADGALRTLQRNAAAKATKKRAATGARHKPR